jgi:hypothetical protein
MYWIGLCILSTSLGVQFGATIGFAALGAGAMLFPIVRAIFRILSTRR